MCTPAKMRSLNRFRLITFDVTDTLLQFRTSPGKQYGEIGALFGARCDNNELAKNYKANWWVEARGKRQTADKS